MKQIFSDPIFLFLDAFLFIFAITMLFNINGVYVKTEKTMTKSISMKNNISTTYENQESIDQTIIDGTTVINEILAADTDIEIKINNTVITNIITPTGDKFIDYIKKYNMEPLMNRVSNTHNYKKTCILNNEGEITGISYLMI